MEKLQCVTRTHIHEWNQNEKNQIELDETNDDEGTTMIFYLYLLPVVSPPLSSSSLSSSIFFSRWTISFSLKNCLVRCCFPSFSFYLMYRNWLLLLLLRFQAKEKKQRFSIWITKQKIPSSSTQTFGNVEINFRMDEFLYISVLSPMFQIYKNEIYFDGVVCCFFFFWCAEDERNKLKRKLNKQERATNMVFDIDDATDVNVCFGWCEYGEREREWARAKKTLCSGRFSQFFERFCLKNGTLTKRVYFRESLPHRSCACVHVFACICECACVLLCCITVVFIRFVCLCVRSLLCRGPPTNRQADRQTDRQTHAFIHSHTRTLAVHLLRSCPICVILFLHFTAIRLYLPSTSALLLFHHPIGWTVWCCACIHFHTNVKTRTVKQFSARCSKCSIIRMIAYIRRRNTCIYGMDDEQPNAKTDTHIHTHLVHISHSLCVLSEIRSNISIDNSTLSTPLQSTRVFWLFRTTFEFGCAHIHFCVD